MAHWRRALRGCVKTVGGGVFGPKSADKNMRLLGYLAGGIAALAITTAEATLAQQAQPKPPAPRPAPATPGAAGPRGQAPAATPAQAPAPPSPATDVPQQTTATYGDWILQCAAINGSATPT